jgi:hypothetical protein
MMKNWLVSILLGAALILVMLGPVGCGVVGKADDIAEQTAADVMKIGPDREATAQMGETAAEGHRRHIRNHRLDRQMLMEDIDSFFMTDEPSRLTDRVIP